MCFIAKIEKKEICDADRISQDPAPTQMYNLTQGLRKLMLTMYNPLLVD